jgi:hypothetical protein
MDRRGFGPPQGTVATTSASKEGDLRASCSHNHAPPRSWQKGNFLNTRPTKDDGFLRPFKRALPDIQALSDTLDPRPPDEFLNAMLELRDGSKEGAKAMCLVVVGEKGGSKSTFLKRYAEENPQEGIALRETPSRGDLLWARRHPRISCIHE